MREHSHLSGDNAQAVQDSKEAVKRTRESVNDLHAALEKSRHAIEAMSHRRCPKCPRMGELLDEASRDAYVDYYRCPMCGHVWAHQKGDVDTPPKDVTVDAETDS
jgi:rubrerythrin